MLVHDLQRRIALGKRLMEKLAERHGLTSPEVLRASIRLDRLLNQAQKCPENWVILRPGDGDQWSH